MRAGQLIEMTVLDDNGTPERVNPGWLVAAEQGPPERFLAFGSEWGKGIVVFTPYPPDDGRAVTPKVTRRHRGGRGGAGAAAAGGAGRGAPRARKR